MTVMSIKIEIKWSPGNISNLKQTILNLYLYCIFKAVYFQDCNYTIKCYLSNIKQ